MYSVTCAARVEDVTQYTAEILGMTDHRDDEGNEKSGMTTTTAPTAGPQHSSSWTTPHVACVPSPVAGTLHPNNPIAPNGTPHASCARTP
jgi:hypothetical protein